MKEPREDESTTLHDGPLASGPDSELLDLLTEVGKSCQSFERALVSMLNEHKATAVDWRDHVLRYWLLYLFLLSYDVGFVTQAILREGLNRQLLTMKRQAFEYAVRAQYIVRYPEKADHQLQALPLKIKSFLRLLSTQNPSPVAQELNEALDEAIRSLPVGMKGYGDVSMIEMVKELYKDEHASIYINNYSLPSAIMHGTRVGIADAITRLPNGKLWMSHSSLSSSKTWNLMVIVDSLIRVLLITGDRFDLYGKHWIHLVERSNTVMEHVQPGSKTLDLCINVDKLRYASTQKPKTEGS